MTISGYFSFILKKLLLWSFVVKFSFIFHVYHINHIELRAQSLWNISHPEQLLLISITEICQCSLEISGTC